jgi:ABC-type phosphate transport system substrate-binding protein
VLANTLIRATAASIVLALAGCGDEAANRSDMEGRITIGASRSAAPFALAALEQFQTEHPAVTIIVDESSSRRTFAALCTGDTDVATASVHAGDVRARACDANAPASRPEVQAFLEFTRDNAESIAESARAALER